MKIPLMVLLAALAILPGARAATIAEVRQQIDPATGKAKDTATEFTVTGVVSARATLADGSVLAFVQPSGEAGLPVLATAADAAQLQPRNEVQLSGKLADGPLGFAVLQVKPGSVTASGSNRPFGTPEARGADALKDASALAGHYLKLSGVTFPGGKFDDSGTCKVKGDAGEVTLRLSKAAAGRDMPSGAMNIYGVPIKVDGGWQLLTARILPANGKEMQELAVKYTCMTCHNPDTKVVGPTYREVAAKYRNDPDAEQKLVTQMENGGTGKWGQVPMQPFKGKVPPEDMKQLAQWILGYRWDAVLAE
ncbi:MAG TPA: c-type cytochrome [Candidatus Acidoferrum sp.]|nr:c-type cytochrome [Candidatus Acidoferrum sp.]